MCFMTRKFEKKFMIFVQTRNTLGRGRGRKLNLSFKMLFPTKPWLEVIIFLLWCGGGGGRSLLLLLRPGWTELENADVTLRNSFLFKSPTQNKYSYNSLKVEGKIIYLLYFSDQLYKIGDWEWLTESFPLKIYDGRILLPGVIFTLASGLYNT